MLHTRKKWLELYVSLGRAGFLRLALPVTTLDQERKIVEKCQHELMDIEIEEFDAELKAKRESKLFNKQTGVIWNAYTNCE